METSASSHTADMESTENQRICCVCLCQEAENDSFASVFGTGIATAIFDISGIAPVELSKGTPSLICGSCVVDVKSAEFVRLQIIRGQKRLAEMNSKTEVALIHSMRKELIVNQPSFPYSLSKETLEKVAAWTRLQEQLKNLKETRANMTNPKKSQAVKAVVKPEPISPIRKHSSEVEFVSTEVGVARKKQASIPVTKFIGKKQKKSKPMVFVKEHRLSQTTVPGIRKEKVKVSKPLRFKNSTRRTHVSTSFECDSCKQCFITIDQLNSHLKSHSDGGDPPAINESLPLLITEIHEGCDFLCDDVILVPPNPPEVIKIDDDDEEEIESLLQMLY